MEQFPVYFTSVLYCDSMCVYTEIILFSCKVHEIFAYFPYFWQFKIIAKVSKSLKQSLCEKVIMTSHRENVKNLDRKCNAKENDTFDFNYTQIAFLYIWIKSIFIFVYFYLQNQVTFY